MPIMPGRGGGGGPPMKPPGPPIGPPPIGPVSSNRHHTLQQHQQSKHVKTGRNGHRQAWRCVLLCTHHKQQAASCTTTVRQRAPSSTAELPGAACAAVLGIGLISVDVSPRAHRSSHWPLSKILSTAALKNGLGLEQHHCTVCSCCCNLVTLCTDLQCR